MGLRLGTVNPGVSRVEALRRERERVGKRNCFTHNLNSFKSSLDVDATKLNRSRERIRDISSLSLFFSFPFSHVECVYLSNHPSPEQKPSHFLPHSPNPTSHILDFDTFILVRVKYRSMRDKPIHVPTAASLFDLPTKTLSPSCVHYFPSQRVLDAPSSPAIPLGSRTPRQCHVACLHHCSFQPAKHHGCSAEHEAGPPD